MRKINTDDSLNRRFKRFTKLYEYQILLKQLPTLFLTLGVAFLFSGCAAVYKGTGDVIIGYSKEEAIPYLLETDDFAMACAMTDSFGSFLYSFERVTRPPNDLKVLLSMMSGQCALAHANQKQLDYLRHVKKRDSASATDARIMQKRYQSLAAKRYYAGYLALAKTYGEPGGDCPKLKSYDDEFYWLIGLLNGLQALFADMKSESMIHVPLDIAAKVSRSAKCLDDKRWWGVPRGLQGAVWAIVPGSGPEEADPFDMLSRASETGENRRVRMAHILEAEVYLAKGRLEQVKSVIRRNAEQRAKKVADPKMKLLDHVAYLHLLQLSDQFWMEEKGHRTPWKQYGTFWNDPADEDELDIEDLL